MTMKVIIIGGVAAGMSAAAKLKRNLKDGVDVDVFERGREVSYAACGIPFFASGRVEDREQLIARHAEEFARQGVRVHLRHEAVGVDVGAKLVDVKNLDTGETAQHRYDKLVVASGAGPRRSPPFDEAWENLFVVRDLDDATAIRRRLEDPAVRRVVVVGGGFIGLEMANASRRRGKEVLVVEFAERVIATMDREITDVIAETLANNGVVVRTGSKVVGFSGKGGVIDSVSVEDANGRGTVQADLVLNCAGIRPQTGFIDVEKSENGAIRVNERMETSVPDVYAGGDCTAMKSFITGEWTYAPLGTNANKQGKIIAEVLSGREAPRFRLLGSSGLRLFGVDAAKVGLSEVEAGRSGLDYRVVVVTGNSYASYYSPEEVTVKLVYESGSRRLLGAQLVGQGVVAARANYFAVAITCGMTVDEFSYVDMLYSPPFSGVWDVTLIAAGAAK